MLAPILRPILLGGIGQDPSGEVAPLLVALSLDVFFKVGEPYKVTGRDAAGFTYTGRENATFVVAGYG